MTIKKIYIIFAFCMLFTFGYYSYNKYNLTETNKNYDLNLKDFEDIILKQGTKDKKILALTFDDGPDEKYTPQILDILKENEVKATFFVTGEKVTWNPEIVKRAHEEGNEIGNHTFTHINVGKRNYYTIETEINKTQEAIKNVIGSEPTIFRPPYRALSRSMLQIVKDKKMKVVLWSNIDPRDWDNPGSNYIASTVINKAQNGNIILLHDYNKVRNSKTQTIEALKTIIPEMKSRGYKFVTISELMNECNIK